MVLQAPFGHKLIHQETVIILHTISYQLHKIWMMKPAQVIDLSQPFLMPLQTFLVQLLYSNNKAHSRLCCNEFMFINPSLENTAKTPLPQHTIRSKISGGILELNEAETVQIRFLKNLSLFSWRKGIVIANARGGIAVYMAFPTLGSSL